MILLLNFLAWTTTIVLSIPLGVFLLETLAALLPWRSPRRETGTRAPAIVLIPAHNEETGIVATLRSVMQTLSTGDRVLVVADNCTDRTAEVARNEGADVVERSDSERRGKGFALQCGVETVVAERQRNLSGNDSRNTEADPVLVFLDADCRVSEETIDQLVRAAHRTGQPVQGLNLSEAEPSGVQAISSLGFHFKNLVRPTGLSRFGLPCHLMGTGMALPLSLAAAAEFGGSHLAEDMQLGIDLALSGRPAHFCQTSLVTSRLPAGSKAFVQQRTRWEHGHLRTSLRQIPRLISGFLRRFDVRLLGLAFDLSIPPFSMLILAGIGGWILCAAAWGLGGSPIPFVAMSAMFFGVAVNVFLGWAKYCRLVVPFRSLVSLPVYVVRKIPIYLAFLKSKGPREWVRTEREAVTGKVG